MERLKGKESSTRYISLFITDYKSREGLNMILQVLRLCPNIDQSWISDVGDN